MGALFLYLTKFGGPRSAYLPRVLGLREVKIKYPFVYFSLNMPLLEILLTGGRSLDFNVVWSKSNIPL